MRTDHVERSVRIVAFDDICRDCRIENIKTIGDRVYGRCRSSDACRFECEYRGKLDAKGKGPIDMYLVRADRDAARDKYGGKAFQ